MIKLFRNLPRRLAGIRKNLLNEGKTNKYLKYAIDEKVLVDIPKTISCPVRDNILVAKITQNQILVPLGTTYKFAIMPNIYRNQQRHQRT